MFSSKKYAISTKESVFTLNVTNCDVSDVGDYQCIISNEGGITEKDPVTLECTVAGTPELRVRWYKDGKQLLPSRYYTMSFENNVASFRIEPVSKEDSGTYSFKVENNFGSSTCEAVLTVLGLKPSPVDIVKGSEVSLECEISGTPPFDVAWFKDRRQIRSSKKYKVTAKNYHTSVRILSVEAADIGEYQCKAQNDVGSDTCVCTVKLKGKVLVHVFSAVLQRYCLALLCGNTVIAGTPQLSTGWFKDGKELTSSQKYKITFLNNVSILKIMDAEKEDGGLYTFAVQNDVGKSSCTASVDVLG
uniref:Ig-like domain-containing protein n=1 Tax=Malurus cyaneus samueli TaxID=2593467 RepID=A0A8C5TW63_9PASS